MLDRLLAGEEYIAEGDDLFEMSRTGLDWMDAYNATTGRQEKLRLQILEQ